MWIKRGTAKTVKDVFLARHSINELNECNDWFLKHYAHQFKIDHLEDAIKLAKEYKNKKITIIGDYDVDGMTSTSILLLAFKWAGFQNVSYRIPKRFSEGFGINTTIIDEISDGLIITCDNGMAQTNVIQYAMDKGFKVIVLDHHLPELENSVNPANIVIDPSAIEGSADFSGYCGAGICYKFAEMLLNYDKILCSKLLGLCTLGTVADVMKLTSENYVFVRNGIMRIKNSSTCMPGLYAIISEANCLDNLSAHDIGFKIAPVLNASSRMADAGANICVEILTYEGPYQNILNSVHNLFKVNELRKEAQKAAISKAKDFIAENGMEKDFPLCIYISDINEGVVGIVAGMLAEEYKVPTIVLTDNQDGLKGSARTYGVYNIKENLDKVSDLLTVYGGHKEAGGLSLKRENYDALRNLLIDNASNYIIDENNDMFYDLEIEAKDIPACIQYMQQYEPYGEGNEMPVFKITNFKTVQNYGFWKKLMGADSNTVKLFSSNSEAVGFNMGKRFAYLDGEQVISFIGTLSDNIWNGKVTHQVLFSDFTI